MKVTAHRWLLCLGAVLAVGCPVFAQAPARPAPSSQPAPAPPVRPSTPSSATAPSNGPSRWWHSDAYRKDLSLTNDQVLRFDHIFDEALPHLTEENNQLDEREAKLSRLIEMNAEDDQITHEIDRVEAARSLLNKDRELMLVHMRQVLTPDQRVKFNQRWARFQQQQPQRQSGPGAPGAPQRSTQPPPSSAAPAKRPE